MWYLKILSGAQTIQSYIVMHKYYTTTLRCMITHCKSYHIRTIISCFSTFHRSRLHFKIYEFLIYYLQFHLQSFAPYLYFNTPFQALQYHLNPTHQQLHLDFPAVTSWLELTLPTNSPG